MYKENTGILSRSGPAIVVFGVHAVLIYGLVASMGIVEMPKIAQSVQAVFIPEQTQAEPEPEIKVKPEIEHVATLDEPPPELQFEEPVVAPVETPLPASENAINAVAAQGAPPQQLKTSSRVEPAYPPASRRAGEEGTVLLKVLVNEKGKPGDVQVAKSSGFERLDAAAMQAVKRWKFVAATDGSAPITAWTQVAITFKLTQS